MRSLLSALALLVLALPATASHATLPDAELRAKAAGEYRGGPFRGSTFTWRSAASAITFDRSAELTYNPTWVNAFELAPRYALSDLVSVSARLDLTYEITEADFNTYENEALLGNLLVAASVGKFATIPGVDVDVSGGLSLLFPTSKFAQAQTLMFAVLPRARLSRSFDVLAGLRLGYGVSLGKYFHRYTTAERDSPLISGCFNSPGGCESHYNTGVRNVSWRIINSLDASLSVTDWLSFGAALSIYTSFLYDDVDDASVSLTPVEPTDTRHALYYDLSVTLTPLTPLDVVIGAQTFSPQRKPDSSDYAPFFNRFTALYLDLRLDIAQLVAVVAK
ncbi:MAG: hypothetical protein CSA66_06850 [Proteobacteria bacterium]|nr:MAG: hypothetical protein CSA66_06850 [Pseudomonadota bacterium]